MAKDARGHGSNGKLAPNAQNTAAGVRKSFQSIYGRGTPAGSVDGPDRRLMVGGGPSDRTLGGYDQGSGSSVSLGGHGGDWGNMQAAQELSSGPKSAPVAVHDSMGYAGVTDPDDLRTA